MECCAKGVAGVLVITAGFGEIDAAGRAQQEELAAICRDAGVRLIGPNCMGLINTAPACKGEPASTRRQAFEGRPGGAIRHRNYGQQH